MSSASAQLAAVTIGFVLLVAVFVIFHQRRSGWSWGDLLVGMLSLSVSLFSKAFMSFFTGDTSYLMEKGEDVEEALDESHGSAYHKWLLRVSTLLAGICAVLGAVLGFLISHVRLANPWSRMAAPLLAAFLFAPLGFLFGMATMCLFAPGEFLRGPVGRKWMNLIGVESVLVARMVCLLSLVVMGFVLLIFSAGNYAGDSLP